MHRDSVVGIKAGGAMVEALQELTHVTGVMKADKLSYEEQVLQICSFEEGWDLIIHF